MVASAFGAVHLAAMFVFFVLPLPLGPRAGGSLCFGAAAALMAVVVVRRAALLEVGEVLRYSRLGGSFHLPRAAAVAVRVLRPTIPLRQATTYALVVRVGAREARLPFAEHWCFGTGPRAEARGLAQQLGVPFEDPTGEAWSARGGPWAWLAAGEEWKLVLILLPPIFGLGALALLLLSLRP